MPCYEPDPNEDLMKLVSVIDKINHQNAYHQSQFIAEALCNWCKANPEKVKLDHRLEKWWTKHSKFDRERFDKESKSRIQVTNKLVSINDLLKRTI